MADQLSELHRLVATSLVEDLQAAALLEDPEARHGARHQARAQAITFLKNHDFKGKADDNAALDELRKQLDQQRKRGAGGMAALQAAAAEFEATLGGNLQ